jgi:hypothetical protein
MSNKGPNVGPGQYDVKIPSLKKNGAIFTK